jgi:acyl-CoA synthetase (AMP-forming)/AMP-acid ligase II
MPQADGAPGVTRRIAALALEDPDRVALVDRGRPVRYGALGTAVALTADWLRGRGLAPGDRVGLTIRDDLQHLVACLALLRLGCHQVTLASHDPPAMRAALAARFGAAVVLAADPGDVPEGAGALVFDPGLLTASAAARPVPESDEGALVLASSGTTGRPKLIPFSAAQLAAQALRRAEAGRTRFRPVAAEHNNAKRLLLLTLANGGTAVLANCLQPGGLAEACARHAVDVASPGAAHLEPLLGAAAPSWPARTRIELAGSQVPGSLRRRIQQALTPELHVVYGATECPGVTRAGPDDHDRHPEGVGRAMEGAAVSVVDDRGRPLPPGVEGFVRIRAPGMARRYLDDPEATERAFRDGWFAPGDLGRLEADGTLVFAGRDDDMMSLGGIKIFPAEIERAAEGFPGLADCAAFALRLPALGDVPVLAVVAAPGAALDAAALLAACRARLGLRAPRKVVLVDALPRNATGKVLRRELAARLAATAAPD